MRKKILWKEKELHMFNFSKMIFLNINFIGKDGHLKQIRLHYNKSNKFLSNQWQFCIPLIVKYSSSFLFCIKQEMISIVFTSISSFLKRSDKFYPAFLHLSINYFPTALVLILKYCCIIHHIIGQGFRGMSYLNHFL